MQELNKLATQIGSSLPPKKPGNQGFSFGGQPVNDPLVDKIKKYLLIGLTAVIGGGAIILIIASVIKKVI